MAYNLAHCLFLQIKVYWHTAWSIHLGVVCESFHSQGQSCSVMLRHLQRLSIHHLDITENVCSPSSTFHLFPLGLFLKTDHFFQEACLLFHYPSEHLSRGHF